MKKNRKKWIWILLGIVVLAVVLFLIFGTARSNAGRYSEETVYGGSIETYYSFSGNIAVRDSQSINAKANVTVREIYVDEEAMVSAGDPLMRLSNGDIVKADIAGEVTEVYVSEGDTVGMSGQLIDIVNFDDLQVLLKVDEFDVAAVSVGKEATVTIEALDMTYQGIVEHIGKQAVISEGDIIYYEAKLSAPKDEHILPGMKVDVKMLNESASDAVLLPMKALQFDAYNKPFVYMRGSGSDVVSVSVGVGIQDGTTVQITQGLRAGDIVLVPQSTSMFPMMGRMGQSDG